MKQLITIYLLIITSCILFPNLSQATGGFSFGFNVGSLRPQNHHHRNNHWHRRHRDHGQRARRHRPRNHHHYYHPLAHYHGPYYCNQYHYPRVIYYQPVEVKEVEQENYIQTINLEEECFFDEAGNSWIGNCKYDEENDNQF